METQLQDVLRLWESAAGEARSDAAAENAELRKQARAHAAGAPRRGALALLRLTPLTRAHTRPPAGGAAAGAGV
jgi:hypothetical protein